MVNADGPAGSSRAATAETAVEDQFDGRIAELVLLQSMYPGQLDLDDVHLQEAVLREDLTVQCPQAVSGLFLVDKTLEVYFVLPAGYPDADARPTVHCRIVDGSLGRRIQKQMNDQVAECLADGEADLIGSLQAIMRLWEDRRLEAEAVAGNADQHGSEAPSGGEELARYWIYSHHIKSKTKRKLIADLCGQLQLSGLMLIGKPGFICIEGSRRDCDTWWTQIRSLTWQRISLVDTETLSATDDGGYSRAFDHFEEHADRSAVFRLLESKGCDTVLKNFLGIRPTTVK